MPSDNSDGIFYNIILLNDGGASVDDDGGGGDVDVFSFVHQPC
ncbi:MAG: hypothetical protein ACRYFL_11475 [Janthinobacterium lividum]